MNIIAKTGASEVRAVLDAWTKALGAKDAAATAAHYAKDIVSFDLDPPLQHAGADNLEKGIEAWFKTWRGPIGYEITAQVIDASGDLAMSRSLNHMTGEKTDGSRADLWFRATVGLRRTGGVWKIIHQHASVPFYMDGSDRAALDLKP